MVRIRDVRLVPLLGAIWFAALVLTALPPEGCAVGLIAALLGAAFMRHKAKKNPENPSWVTWQLAAIGVSLLALNIGLQSWALHQAWAEFEGEQVQVWAVATGDSRELRGSRGPPIYLTTARIEGRGNRTQPESIRTRAVVFGGGPHFAGQRLRIIGMVTEVGSYRDIAVTIRAHSIVVEREPGGIWILPNALRAGLREEVSSRGSMGAGLFMAITLGDEAELDSELDAAMRTVSLTHITAVSGAHFAIILAAAIALISWVPGGTWRIGMILIVLPFLLVPLVHPSPSVLRASITALVTGLAILLGRISQALTALTATALVLLCLDPWLATNYGFVLSVVATGGIVLLCNPVADSLTQFMPGVFAKAISVPFCAQMACAPVLVMLTPQLSPYAVLANVVTAAALVPITLCGLLACLLLPLLPGVGNVLITLGSACSEVVVWAARWTAQLPGAAFPWPSGLFGAVLAGAVSAALTCAVLLAGLHRAAASRPECENMAGS